MLKVRDAVVAIDPEQPVFDIKTAAGEGMAKQLLPLTGDLTMLQATLARASDANPAITERFEDLDRLYDIGDIDLHLSGCINSCGHHHSGHIGILGVDKDGAEWYQLTLGGTDGSTRNGQGMFAEASSLALDSRMGTDQGLYLTGSYRGTVGLVLRVIPTRIRSIEELGLPGVLAKIADEDRGLVLVTGPTGSGKTTTLASMINIINEERDEALQRDVLAHARRKLGAAVAPREVAFGSVVAKLDTLGATIPANEAADAVFGHGAGNPLMLKQAFARGVLRRRVHRFEVLGEDQRRRLLEIGIRPERIDTTATVTLEKLEGGFTVTRVHLDVTVAAPGVPATQWTGHGPPCA